MVQDGVKDELAACDTVEKVEAWVGMVVQAVDDRQLTIVADIVVTFEAFCTAHPALITLKQVPKLNEVAQTLTARENITRTLAPPFQPTASAAARWTATPHL